jgi:hypothetical protein
MATDIFHEPKKEIPKNDGRIVRVDFDQVELGARKSHLARIPKNRNEYTVKHIKGA